jgi:hypothetical protein
MPRIKADGPKALPSGVSGGEQQRRKGGAGIELRDVDRAIPVYNRERKPDIDPVDCGLTGINREKEPVSAVANVDDFVFSDPTGIKVIGSRPIGEADVLPTADLEALRDCGGACCNL